MLVLIILPPLFVPHYFQYMALYPADSSSAQPVMREMEVVVAEVVRVFIKQTVKGFERPIEALSWNGDAAESAVLPNELDWPIEAGPFHRSQGGQSV